MDWWVTKGDRKTVGPVSTELLLQGIGAGKVPMEALVCEVGGESWKPIIEVLPFSRAFDRPARKRMDSWDDSTEAGPPAAEFFEEADEQTLVDALPRGADPPTDS